MTQTKTYKPGQFQKMTRRFRELRLFGADRIHAMRYERDGRYWSVECDDDGGFPSPGYMLRNDVEQPDITCKHCLHDLDERS